MARRTVQSLSSGQRLRADDTLHTVIVLHLPLLAPLPGVEPGLVALTGRRLTVRPEWIVPETKRDRQSRRSHQSFQREEDLIHPRRLIDLFLSHATILYPGRREVNGYQPSRGAEDYFASCGALIRCLENVPSDSTTFRPRLPSGALSTGRSPAGPTTAAFYLVPGSSCARLPDLGGVRASQGVFCFPLPLSSRIGRQRSTALSV